MPEIQPIHIDSLDFDASNPRLPKSVQGGGQDDILCYLALKTNIAGLMVSIGENDFFQGEAVVVTRQETEGATVLEGDQCLTAAENGAAQGEAAVAKAQGTERFTVLEGNRRLTALKLLNKPDLIPKNAKGLREIVDAAKHKPDHLPAYMVEKREDALRYLGFRHISGVQRWGSLAKARYLDLMFTSKEGDPDEKYATIASEIGSRADSVRRNLDALAAYNLVETEKFFRIPELGEETFQFGVFYTAVANANIAEFVGARKDGVPTHPIVQPKCLKISELEEITRWMFYKDPEENYKTKLGESRNIHQLAAVVASPNALEKLRSGASLRAAYNDTPDTTTEFVKLINGSTRLVRSADEHVEASGQPNEEAAVAVQRLIDEVNRLISRHPNELRGVAFPEAAAL